jgi:hypothetical protein
MTVEFVTSKGRFLRKIIAVDFIHKFGDKIHLKTQVLGDRESLIITSINNDEYVDLNWGDGNLKEVLFDTYEITRNTSFPQAEKIVNLNFKGGK